MTTDQSANETVAELSPTEKLLAIFRSQKEAAAKAIAEKEAELSLELEKQRVQIDEYREKDRAFAQSLSEIVADLEAGTAIDEMAVKYRNWIQTRSTSVREEILEQLGDAEEELANLDKTLIVQETVLKQIVRGNIKTACRMLSAHFSASDLVDIFGRDPMGWYFATDPSALKNFKSKLGEEIEILETEIEKTEEIIDSLTERLKCIDAWIDQVESLLSQTPTPAL